jgi:UDP-2,3-diacylglucosamine pyrophosphatase LpxH
MLQVCVGEVAVADKLKLILSDLHIGANNTASDNNLCRTFSATDDFITFLRTVSEESEQHQREIELIINGDFLAFLQVPAVDTYNSRETYPVEAFQDSSQEASLKRLKIIVDTNTAIFEALAGFIQVEGPQRRLTVIKGNHDMSLFWPGIKNRLRELLGASGERASLLRFADEFVSREQIYIEHGHQRAEKMNGYQDSFDPRSEQDLTQLHYPAGSRFIIDFLNQAKEKWWFVDHVKPVTTLIWYAFKWNFDFACQALASFIRHTPALVVSNYQIGGQLPPSTELFLNRLEDPDQRQQLFRQYIDSVAFRQEFHRQVQQYLDDATVDNRGETHWPFLDISADPFVMGQEEQRRQHTMLEQAARRIAGQEGAKVVVFGHTHYPTQQQLHDGSLYINTGSWIKDLSNAHPDTWRMLFNGEVYPNQTPAQFPYARIDYEDQKIVTAQLLYFPTSLKSNH